jgi:alpha-tubulin suppressor-like RCC1 family protein
MRQARAKVGGRRKWAGIAAAAVALALSGSSALGSGPTVVSVSAGALHTCAVTGGGVFCWGYNAAGQLGDGTTTQSLTPVAVPGLASGVQSVAAGGTATCALTTSGGVKCWGDNAQGTLGDGTTVDSTTPVDVTGLSSGVAAISAGAGGGGGQMCALTTAGGVKCWGANGFGQLGDGTTSFRSSPVDVSGLTSGVAAVSAGAETTCALTTGGGVKCWGRGDYGELGTGSTADSATPLDVSGLTSGVTAVAAGGGHACALLSGGTVDCWGLNDWGQLGDGTTTMRLTPTPVSGLTGVVAITAGSLHTCALTAAGGEKCWGVDANGSVGDNLGVSSDPTPTDVFGLTSGAQALASGAGGQQECAILTGGGLKCWGWNAYGQVGDGTTSNALAPTDIAFPAPAPDFTIAVNPGSGFLQAGSSNIALPPIVQATALNGLTGTLTLALTSSPSWASLNDTTICAGCSTFLFLSPPSGTAPGDYAVTVTATSNSNPSLVHSATYTLTVTAPPDSDLALANVPADIVAEATGPSGTTVAFTPPTAVDEDSPLPVVSCDNPSTYQLGTTTVTCTVSDPDDSNSPVSASFTVKVQDTTRPAITVTPSQVVFTSAQPGNTPSASLAVTATATDAVDPSPTVTCSPGLLTLTAPGTVSATCTATDFSGNSSSATTSLTVVDDTPPVLTLPAPITVDASSSAGAVVTFTATAVDNADGSRPVSCTPPSGSTFAIGTTTVNCSASDLSGNTAAGSFIVTVRNASPSAQLTSLSSSLAGVGGGSFSSQLNQAIAQLAAGQTQAACNDLTAFANHVKAQSGKQLTTTQANALLAQIAQIKSAIGC